MGSRFDTTFATTFGGASSQWDAEAESRFTAYLAVKLGVSAAQIAHTTPLARRRRLSEGGWSVGTTVQSDSPEAAAAVQIKLRDDVTVAEISSAVGIEAQAKSDASTVQYSVSLTPSNDSSNRNLLLLLLLLLLVLVLLPLVYFLRIWCTYRAKTGLYLSWAWHHTNAGIIFLYMPAEEKDALAAQLWPNKAMAGDELPDFEDASPDSKSPREHI